MSKKLYFEGEEAEGCYSENYFIDKMKEEGLTEIKVFRAVIEKDTDHFWCAEFQEIGLKSDGNCGRDCEKYSPRNGKNGRCRFSKNCYMHGEEVTLKLKP